MMMKARSGKFRIVCAFWCAVLLAVGLQGGRAFAATEQLTVAAGTTFTIEDGGSAIRQLPFLEAFDNHVIASFSQHPDAVIDHPTDGVRVSADGGATWPTYAQHTDFYLTSVVKLANGNWLGMSYITTRIDARNETCYYWISADNGATWTPYTGTVHFPQDMATYGTSNWGGLLFHRSIIQMADGSLQGTVYGKYASDTKYRSLWVKSTDGGANWNVVSTIAHDTTGSEGFCEPVTVRVADGSLLTVMRVGSGYPLYQSRSTDNGLTWSVPTKLPGVNETETYSVDPDLTLMANGTLVLSYGRPETRLLFALDGSGYNWDEMATTFTAPNSGYTGVREVAPNKLLVIADERSGTSAPTKIVGKYVTVTRDVVHATGTKLDLLAKYNSGAITVSTDMLYTNPTYPSIQVSGALDGSVDYWHTASKASAAVPSYYTIALDRTYTIKTLGIALKPQYRESADIYFSTDGVNWGSPVRSYTNAIQSAVRYTVFPSAIAARYVKVNVTAANGWPTLNEIELYSEDQFESDTIGAAPAGYTLTGANAVVTNARVYAGAQSLHVYDTSTSVLTNVAKITAPQAAKYFEAMVYPAAAPSGDIISINSGANDNAHSVFHIAIMSDGSLKWYNGSAWQPIGGAGTIPFNGWSKIAIDATSTANANVYVNDVLKGAIGKWNTFPTMDRVRFMSGSTAGTGDDYYVDNVNFN